MNYVNLSVINRKYFLHHHHLLDYNFSYIPIYIYICLNQYICVNKCFDMYTVGTGCSHFTLNIAIIEIKL